MKLRFLFGVLAVMWIAGVSHSAVQAKQAAAPAGVKSVWEGAAAAGAILRHLKGDLPSFDQGVPVEAGAGLRYAYPQRLLRGEGRATLFARSATRHDGALRLVADGRVVAEKRVRVLPERRLTMRVEPEVLARAAHLTLDLA